MAAREAWRPCFAWLNYALGDLDEDALPEHLRNRLVMWPVLLAAMTAGINSPIASSAGRLFDAVSALAGLAPLRNEYEAEAAVRLEAAAASGRARPYAFALTDGSPKTLSFGPMIEEIAAGVRRGVSPSVVSARFHETLAAAAVETARAARRDLGLRTVVLGGGVFCNRRLLGRIEARLAAAGFTVLRPRRYSPNDESISVGQTAYALARLNPAS